MSPIRQCIREPSLGHLQQYHEADPLLLEPGTAEIFPLSYQLFQMHLDACDVIRSVDL
jgi:hypothetical protein